MQMGDTGSKGGGGRRSEGGGGHYRWEGTLAPGMSHPSEELTTWVPAMLVVINGCECSVLDV